MNHKDFKLMEAMGLRLLFILPIFTYNFPVWSVFAHIYCGNPSRGKSNL